MRKMRFIKFVIIIILTIALLPTTVLAKKHSEELSNNLSFPAIAVDGFSITPLTSSSFTVPYSGDNPGLTADEIAWLSANGPWYAQKTTGNAWQADYVNQGSVSATMVDWSDNIETLNPKVRSSFRLELTIYKTLDISMTAFTMAVLEYPNSSSELQGTNNTTREVYEATIISDKPRLVVQYIGSSVPDLVWDDNGYWYYDDDGIKVIPTVVPVPFAPELNVGGKYIFGASSGGWKPSLAGYYRLTFYLPTGCGISLSEAVIGNVPTTQKATANIDGTNNLTYIDVQAVNKRN